MRLTISTLRESATGWLRFNACFSLICLCFSVFGEKLGMCASAGPDGELGVASRHGIRVEKAAPLGRI